MILKNEILEKARQSGLTPHVIEKDYVLGWILGAISQERDLQESWVFKGGTCLKKCYFDTYRMSEDLDFTLKDSSHLSLDFLKSTFSRIRKWVYNMSGIIIPEDRISFDFYENPRGNIGCEGRIYYQGPIAPSSPKQTPRIKLDLSSDEVLVEKPVLRGVDHPFSDKPNNNFNVLSYSYLEIFAEKIRALSDRARPRDLYDVIHFFRRPESDDLFLEIERVLTKKCEFKNLPFPTFPLLQDHKNFCEFGWLDQLGHQLPVLPSFESFWNDLRPFFDWLEGIRGKEKLPRIESTHKYHPVQDIHCIDVTGQGIIITNRLQFAAINRLCVEITFLGEDKKKIKYIVEPYSIEMINGTKLILYCLDYNTREKLTLSLGWVLKANITNVHFKPVYEIDFIPKMAKSVV